MHLVTRVSMSLNMHSIFQSFIARYTPGILEYFMPVICTVVSGSLRCMTKFNHIICPNYQINGYAIKLFQLITGYLT